LLEASFPSALANFFFTAIGAVSGKIMDNPPVNIMSLLVGEFWWAWRKPRGGKKMFLRLPVFIDTIKR
jgi:hypothetical protein